MPTTLLLRPQRFSDFPTALWSGGKAGAKRGSRGILALMSPKRGPEPTITDLGEEQASNSIVVCSIVGMNIFGFVCLCFVPEYLLMILFCMSLMFSRQNRYMVIYLKGNLKQILVKV